MKSRARSLLPLCLALCANAALAQAPEEPTEQEPAQQEPAQEQAPTPEVVETTEPARPSRLLAEVEAWVSQPAGLEYTPATQRSPNDPFGTQVLQLPHGTETQLRYRVGYELPGETGNLSVTYYAHETESDLSEFSPGDYIYGETLAHPFLAGFNNDGLADAFEAGSSTRLRDWHIDFSREAFRTPRVSGRWSVNWRRVTHARNLSSIYHAVVSDLPPLIPPFFDLRPDLLPLSDRAEIHSNFSGRGPGAGLDLDFPLWNEKVIFEGGFGMAVLRGSIASSYFSVNQFYLLDAPEFGFDNVVLGPPYDELELFFFRPPPPPGGEFVPVIDFVQQLGAGSALSSPSISTSSQVLESYLGFRWKLLRRYELFGGFRSTRYTNVGVDLRPKAATLTISEDGLGIVNLQDVDEVDRSATYEGLYLGLTFHLF